MKFILFYVMVVVAVLYLVSVDEKPRELPKTFFRLKTEVAENLLLERSRQKLEEFKLKEAAKSPSSAKQDFPEKKDERVGSQPVIKKVPALPAETDVALRPVNNVPENRGTAKSDIPKSESSRPMIMERAKVSAKKPKYMTPKQRRRELYRLAYDMEMIFADKLKK
jgi:hypothetical protein|tara:strand:+ start:560 stop:1057 length:498 start_codon:yes stop_codon:yes gene_type:complete